jgi:hypothetical protein
MKRCLVLGNGPTLKDMPRELLAKYPTFGSNRVYLLGNFTPTYYACVNNVMLQQIIPEILPLQCEKYIKAKFSHLVPDSTPLNDIGCDGLFSFHPDKYVWEGYTVTYVLLQLAYWKGFEEVGLLGVRHEYNCEGKPNELQRITGEDINHFAPDYMPPGFVWNLPDLENSERAYGMAKQVYTSAGRRIVNLTPGTKLEVFEKGDYTEWL